jgi:hypothetical protein
MGSVSSQMTTADDNPNDNPDDKHQLTTQTINQMTTPDDNLM